MARCIIIFLFLSLCSVSTLYAQTDQEEDTVKGITVDSICFASGVESRDPVDCAERFAEGKVFCWTKISASAFPVEFKHIWYKDTVNVAEIPLVLKYPSGRFWSYKTVTAGNWRVDVVDGNGSVIKSLEMVVQ